MSTRVLGLSVVVFIIIILSAALSLEQMKHLQPCNLCILQRLAYLSCGLAGLFWLVLPLRRWSGFLGAYWLSLSSVAGLALAGRQLWLQHLPVGQAPACGPGFHYVLDNFPLKEALTLLLQGDGNCAAVDWRLLSFSMAMWSALAFLLLFFVSIVYFYRRHKS